jgi:prepilin-type N-terminal cleavage/methylation domain-containing protein
MKPHHGFSLIELLIVIVIIGILAALSVAGLLASRRSANEGSAVSSMRLLHGAQMTYSSSFGAGEFAGPTGTPTINGLTILRGYELIDPVLGSGSKSGFNFVGARVASTPTSPAQFFFSAIPVSANPLSGTGSHRFGVSTDGVLRTDTTTTDQYADVNAVTAAPAMGN